MRILFLAPHPFFAERGTPIAVRLAVEALCKAGHEVDLLTYHEGQDIAVPGMRLIRIARPPGVRNVPIGFSSKKLLCDLWLAVAALRLLRRGGYDVVHAVEESVFIALAGRRLARFRLVYDMDSLMADQIAEKWGWVKHILPLLRWFERQAIGRSELVLPVCEAIAERVRPHTEPARVHLLPDVALPPGEGGGPIESLRELVGDKEAPIALYVGNLETYQGIELLIEGLAALPPERRCNLVVIGGTPEAIELHRVRAERMGIAAHSRFLGQRPIAALGGFLAQADILCSPRLQGVNTPMKIYSYMAAGRAILATDIASHSQVLDKDCALLVPARGVAVAAGLARLTGDAALRARLGAAAAARAGDLYSLAAYEARLGRAYGAMLALPPRSERVPINRRNAAQSGDRDAAGRRHR
jgi:glycosyltransferase involved in cell wall biosynthesis